METILKYFNDLSERQREQFGLLAKAYTGWNGKINVISRKDIDQLYVRHVLHSLAIAKVLRFREHTRVLDVGTGGGFPGIPLAILFPDCRFTLVDSVGKKIKVVADVAERLGLKNVTAVQGRAETLEGKYDFVVSRAVTEMTPFLGWIWNKIEPGGFNDLQNGVLYLKGGELTEELDATRKEYHIYDIPQFFGEEFFETKRVVYIPKRK